MVGEQSPAAEDSEAAEVDIWLPEPRPYQMAAGDGYLVNFFYFPEYNVSGFVRPDGYMTVPLVGDINVEGLTPAQVSDSIRTRYASVLAEPEVSVIITEPASQRYFVFGEVGQPGAYAIGGRMSVLDAIAQAGGVKVSGRTDNIILMRKTDDGRYVARRIDLSAMIRSEETQVTRLMPADVIFVPATAIAKLNTFVDQFFNNLSPVWRFYILANGAINRQGSYVIDR